MGKDFRPEGISLYQDNDGLRYSNDYNFLSFQAEIPVGSDGVPSRIQILKTAKFFYNNEWVTVDKKYLEEIVENFDKRTLKRDVSIDYSHWDKSAGAAGWFRSLVVEFIEDKGHYGLFAEMEWTEKGANAIKQREFKYVSPEFFDNYEESEGSRKTHGPLLFGCTLTNHPFSVDMDPLFMENRRQGQGRNNFKMSKGESKMNYAEKIMELFGASSMEEAYDLAVEKMAKIKEMEEKKMEEDKKMEENKKMEEDKNMEEKNMSKEKDEKIIALEKQVKSFEKKSIVDKLLFENKINKAQADKALSFDGEKFDGFIEFAKQSSSIPTPTGASFSEQELNKQKNIDDKESLKKAKKEFEELVEDAVKNEGMSLLDARKKVLTENSEILDKLRGGI